MKTLKKLIIAAFLIVPLSAQAENKQPDISTTLMRSTFKIQGEKSFGTVFIMGEHSTSNPKKSYYILISAAHVLEGIKSDFATIQLRIKDGEKFTKLPFQFQIRKEGKPLWIKHPQVDVAAMRARLPKVADIALIPTTLLGRDELLEKFEVHPGDQLFVLGYPYGAEANDAGFPILRSGRIASYPLIPTNLYKTFLLDFEVFGGNSGGPVLLYSKNRAYGGKAHIGSVQFIIGVVSQERGVEEKVESLTETVVHKHKLALAVISQARFVADLIDMLPRIDESASNH